MRDMSQSLFWMITEKRIYFLGTLKGQLWPLCRFMQVLLVRRGIDRMGPLEMPFEEVKAHKCLVAPGTDVTDIRFFASMTGFMALAFILA